MVNLLNINRKKNRLHARDKKWSDRHSKEETEENIRNIDQCNRNDFPFFMYFQVAEISETAPYGRQLDISVKGCQKRLTVIFGHILNNFGEGAIGSSPCSGLSAVRKL